MGTSVPFVSSFLASRDVGTLGVMGLRHIRTLISRCQKLRDLHISSSIPKYLTFHFTPNIAAASTFFVC